MTYKRHSIKRLALTGLLLALFCLPGAATETETQDFDTPFQIKPLTGPIKIDGHLDDTGWMGALKFELPYDIVLGQNMQAMYRTEVFISYNENNLYVAFKAQDDNPKNIRARIRQRDEIWEDDRVSISIDTFNDKRNSFTFSCNPLGVNSDSDWGGTDWDANWDSAGRITESGYAIEMAIPFKELRFPGIGSEMIWGVSFSRNLPRDITHRFSDIPIDWRDNCEQCQWQKIVGFKGITPKRDIELMPTFTAARSDALSSYPNGVLTEADSEANLGLTGTWGISPNFTMSMMADSDFSEVEADTVQVDINRRFPLLYTSERRPFFLEGSEFFRNIQTRSLISPVYGAKLMGKQGRNAVGLMYIKDNSTRVFFPSSEYGGSAYLNSESNNYALNYSRDLFLNSSLNFAYGNKTAGDYSNRVFSMNGNFSLTRQDSLNVSYSGSITNYDDETALKHGQEQGDFYGDRYSLGYSRYSRNYSVSVNYSEVDFTFRDDLNMLSMAGIANFSSHLSYQWFGNNRALITSGSLSGSYNRSSEVGGETLNESTGATLSLRGQLQSSLMVSYDNSKHTVFGVPFENNSVSSMFSIRPNASVRGSLRISMSDDIDYARLRKGLTTVLSPNLSLSIGSRIQLTTSLRINRFTIDDEELFSYTTFNLSPTYHFSAKSHIRVKLQYVNVAQNQDMYDWPVEPSTTTWLSQFVFKHQFNAHTFIYLGYNDRYYGTSIHPTVQTDRSYFVKMGYSWGL